MTSGVSGINSFRLALEEFRAGLLAMVLTVIPYGHRLPTFQMSSFRATFPCESCGMNPLPIPVEQVFTEVEMASAWFMNFLNLVRSRFTMTAG